MKNQYVGDENDFRKYAVLRSLTGDGTLRAGVCWMLTPNDGRADGGLVDYVHDPGRWRDYDPPLFDMLAVLLSLPDGRNVRRIEESGLLPGARFFSDAVATGLAARQHWWERMLIALAGVDLLFFDPDNGLAPRRYHPSGRRADKHLRWDELSTAYTRGASVLVYQHYPRRPRRAFVDDTVGRALNETGAADAWSLETSRVAFILLAHPRHAAALAAGVAQVGHTWCEHITVCRHEPRPAGAKA